MKAFLMRKRPLRARARRAIPRRGRYQSQERAMMVVEPTKLRRKAMKPVPAPTMRPARGRTSARTLRGLKTRAVPTNLTMNPTRRRS